MTMWKIVVSLRLYNHTIPSGLKNMYNTFAIIMTFLRN